MIHEHDQTAKRDGGKLDWSLMPWETLKGAVRVLMFGAKKYSRGSFKTVRPFNERYFSALCRHIFAWYGGERIDPETGESHLAHAACNLIFLIWGELNGVIDSEAREEFSHPTVCNPSIGTLSATPPATEYWALRPKEETKPIELQRHRVYKETYPCGALKLEPREERPDVPGTEEFVSPDGTEYFTITDHAVYEEYRRSLKEKKINP